MTIKNNQLYLGKIKVAELAEKFGTPLYVYDFDQVVTNIEKLKGAFKKIGLKIKIYYAVKANSSLALLHFLKNKVDGIDAASPYEVKIALEAGFDSNNIMVTTPTLTEEDLNYLMRKKILINADSFSQIDKIAKIEKSFQIGIRINPLIEIGSHSHIRTGGKHSKFGIIPEKVIKGIKIAKGKGLEVIGLHCHAGSNWLAKDLPIFRKIAKVITETAKMAGKFKKLTYLDFGGGLGIPLSPGEKSFTQNQLVQYAKIIKKSIKDAKIKEARIEPGRFLIGNAGVLLTKVVHLAQGEKPIDVAIVDAGFNIFSRPFIYGAYHRIIACSKANQALIKKYMIGGNLCEGGDVFNVNKKELRSMPLLEENDLLAVLNAGAYGFSMSSQFNLRPRPAEVSIINSKAKLIRKRENYQDLIKNQIFVI